MLRKLRIGARINVLIVLPLIAVAALVGAAIVGVSGVGMDGAAAQRVAAAEQFRSDFAPAPASLASTWTYMLKIQQEIAAVGGVDDEAQSRVDAMVFAIDELHGSYDERMAFWRQAAVAQRMVQPVLASAQAAGAQFWSQYEQAFTPAVAAGDADLVAEAINSMQPSYAAHIDSVATALAAADQELVAGRTDADGASTRLAEVLAGIGLLLMLVVVVVGLRVRRSIVGPIQRLAASARDVASHDLPDAVRQVQSLAAGETLPPLHSFPNTDSTTGTDELAELANSFATMHDVAVNLAAEQAGARQVVAANLVNVARRTQGLLDRTLRFITELERNERDPDTLENLFQLDHLTTRMRRQAQSLLVLADATPNRLWSAPLDAGDVVRAALAQVEDYSKVEIGDVGTAKVLGAVASDIAHLLAELLENATSFSPPGHGVRVVGKSFPTGHTIAIVDNGIGMTADELMVANRRLSEVTQFEQHASRMLGLQVVARLAARHGVRVQLIETTGGVGVTAVVELPAALLDTTPAPAPAPIPSAFEALTPEPVAPVILPPSPIVTPSPVVPVLAQPTHQPLVFTDAAQPAPQLAVPVFVEPVPVATVAVTPAAPVAAPSVAPAGSRRVVMPPITMVNGLSKRVRGAQMPDLGRPLAEHTDVHTTPEETRVRLSSLQRGVSQGREAVDLRRRGGN